jgi:hypothetical protein
MSEKPADQKLSNPTSVGPVKPGTPLYRALEIIAGEIAKSLEDNSPSKIKRQTKP